MLQEEGVDHEAGHASHAATSRAPAYERADSFEPPDAARYTFCPQMWTVHTDVSAGVGLRGV